MRILVPALLCSLTLCCGSAHLLCGLVCSFLLLGLAAHVVGLQDEADEAQAGEPGRELAADDNPDGAVDGGYETYAERS